MTPRALLVLAPVFALALPATGFAASSGSGFSGSAAAPSTPAPRTPTSTSFARPPTTPAGSRALPPPSSVHPSFASRAVFPTSHAVAPSTPSSSTSASSAAPPVARPPATSLPPVIAGYIPVVGPRSPTGSYVNRAYVESSIASRGRFLDQSKSRLATLEGLVSTRTRDAANAKAAETRNRSWTSSHALTPDGRRLDPVVESSYHAAGQNAYQASEALKNLKDQIGTLRQQIARDTKSYEAARSELAAHPEVQWFQQ